MHKVFPKSFRSVAKKLGEKEELKKKREEERFREREREREREGLLGVVRERERLLLKYK